MNDELILKPCKEAISLSNDEDNYIYNLIEALKENQD